MGDLVMDEAHSIGQLLLSPTRTFAPPVKQLLYNHFEKIHGMVHCSGGGQTKCMKYVPKKLKIIKDNLFEPPYIFDIIQQSSGADAREMYQVFNMGCRLEIYCKSEDAAVMIDTAKQFGIDAQVIGRVEAAAQQSLVITSHSGELIEY
jgi:phosphoribosylformylglycinamidine cyclo-ligase